MLPSNWTGVPNKVAGECMCVYCVYLLCIYKYTYMQYIFWKYFHVYTFIYLYYYLIGRRYFSWSLEMNGTAVGGVLRSWYYSIIRWLQKTSHLKLGQPVSLCQFGRERVIWVNVPTRAVTILDFSYHGYCGHKNSRYRYIAMSIMLSWSQCHALNASSAVVLDAH